MLPTNDGGPYWSQIDEVHGRYDCLYTAACRSPGWSAFKGLPFRKQTMMCLPITNTSSPHIAWPRMTLHQRSSLHDTSHLVPSCPLSSITCVHRHGAKGSQGVQKRCKCITSTGHWLILRPKRWQLRSRSPAHLSTYFSKDSRQKYHQTNRKNPKYPNNTCWKKVQGTKKFIRQTSHWSFCFDQRTSISLILLRRAGELKWKAITVVCKICKRSQ